MADYLEYFKVKIREKPDDELQAILLKPDEYAEEALDFVKREVLRRGKHTNYVLALPDKRLLKLAAESPENELPDYIDAAKAEITRRGRKEAPADKFSESREPVSGKFRKVRVTPIARSGQYRGAGSIQLLPEGLKISGRHVFSMGARWAIGLGLFFGSLLLSSAVTGGSGYCAPGFIPIYFLVEYFLLKREEILVPYSDINRLGGDERHALVGIEFDSEPYRTPVALHTPKWKSVLAELQQRASMAGGPQVEAVITTADGVKVEAVEGGEGEKKASPRVIKPWSKSRVVTMSALVCFGFYILFYFCCSLVLIAILSIAEIKGGIPGIRNHVLRGVLFALLFLTPTIPTYFLTRRYFRKKSKLMLSSGISG